MTVHIPESLRDMRLFIAVYEERSFTAAAQRENATQPGVSQHIRKLEEMVGSKLLVRGAGEVSPTPAGDAFYLGCIEVLQAFQRMRRNLARFEGILEGEVTVGLTPTMARCVLAPALSRIVTLYPNVVVRIVESYSAEITDRIRAGVLDFAIVPAMPDDAGIRGRLVARTPEFLVTSATESSSLRPGSVLKEIPPLKLVLPSKIQARRAFLDRYIAATGLRVERTLEMDSMFGTLDFVATTDWATILPGIMLSRERDLSRFAIHSLKDPDLFLDLFRIESMRRPLSTAAEMIFSEIEQETQVALMQVQLLNSMDTLHRTSTSDVSLGY